MRMRSLSLAVILASCVTGSGLAAQERGTPATAAFRSWAPGIAAGDAPAWSPARSQARAVTPLPHGGVLADLDTTRVRRRRKTYSREGAIIGALVGAAGVALGVRRVCAASASDASALVPCTIGGGLLGAGLGALVGYGIGREYERPAPPPSAPSDEPRVTSDMRRAWS